MIPIPANAIIIQTNNNIIKHKESTISGLNNNIKTKENTIKSLIEKNEYLKNELEQRFSVKKLFKK